MRFGRRTNTDSVRGPKSPWGLLRLVIVLGFVLLGMQWAAQGKHWAWLTGAPNEADPLSALTALDFQVQPKTVSSTPGEARLTPSTERNDNADLSQRLPTECLDTMADGTLGLNPSEQQGLDLAIQLVRPQGTGTVADHVGFAILNEHPEQYRGRLLEFRGTLRRLSQLSARSPASPGAEVYEAWLYTPDAGNHPTRVLFTDLPPSLKPGERLDQPVQFSGYFMKRYGYETSGGTHLAPLFVAKTLVPLAEAIAPSEVRVMKTGQRRLGELLVVVAASAMLIWSLTRTRKPNEP